MNKQMRNYKRRLTTLQMKVSGLATEINSHAMGISMKGADARDETNLAIQVHVASVQLSLALKNPVMKG